MKELILKAFNAELHANHPDGFDPHQSPMLVSNLQLDIEDPEDLIYELELAGFKVSENELGLIIVG